MRYSGLWEFPGGKIEPGESDLEAVRGEFREVLDPAAALILELGEAEERAIGAEAPGATSRDDLERRLVVPEEEPLA